MNERPDAVTIAYADMFEWCLDDPSGACLAFAEAENPDTHGIAFRDGKHEREPTAAEERRYILERIAEFMAERKQSSDAASQREETK